VEALFSGRESEVAANCSECGLFVMVETGRERVRSQAIRPLAPLKQQLTDSAAST